MGAISNLVRILSKGGKVLSKGGRLFKNRMNYTVCMDRHEEAVDVFRVCNDHSRWIDCYRKLNKEPEIIRVNKEICPLCPFAAQAYNQDDYDKHKIS